MSRFSAPEEEEDEEEEDEEEEQWVEGERADYEPEEIIEYMMTRIKGRPARGEEEEQEEEEEEEEKGEGKAVHQGKEERGTEEVDEAKEGKGKERKRRRKLDAQRQHLVNGTLALLVV